MKKAVGMKNLIKSEHTFIVGVAGTGKAFGIKDISNEIVVLKELQEKERKEQEMIDKMADAIVEYDKIKNNIYLDKSLYGKKGKMIKNWNKTKFYQK